MNFQTERLSIRTFKLEDKSDLFEFYRDEEICRYLLHEPWEKEILNEKMLAKVDNDSLAERGALSLAVVLEEKVIGDISVWYTDMKETVEIGFVFNPKFAAQGYAKESVRAVIEKLFSEYKIHRIQANLDARNLLSAKLCENLGMRREAHFIQDYWSKGEWTDSYVYGMLESDL